MDHEQRKNEVGTDREQRNNEAGMDHEQRKLALEVIFPSRFLVVPSREDKAICLVWRAETEVRNVLWVRLIILRLGWPPIRHIEAFMYQDK